MDFLIIVILLAIGITAIYFAGTAIDDNVGFAYCPLLIGIMFIVASIIITSKYTEEASVRRYVNDELTYDTISINKEGKLLEIKVMKNE